MQRRSGWRCRIPNGRAVQRIKRHGGTASRVERWSLALGAFLLLALATPAEASHSGPVIYVDSLNPPEDDADGDRHFRTLAAALIQFPRPGENDTVLVAPGRYTGDLVIDVEGLTLRATGAAEGTVIAGSVSIRAERVRLQELTIESSGNPFGVRVEADKARLTDLRVFGAEVGLWIEGDGGVRDLTLADSHLYHNGTGLRADDLRYAELVDNQVEANELGGRIHGGYSLTLDGNRWRANGDHGLVLQGGLRFELRGETFEGNRGDGLRAGGVSRLEVVETRFAHNGATGLRWLDTQDSAVSGSAFEGNGVAGLWLGERSQRNRAFQNAFRGHSAADAAGLVLDGAAYDNAFEGNVFASNRVAVRLSGRGHAAPGGNRLLDNEIRDSTGDGVRVEASEGDNAFEGNVLHGNNGHGFVLAGRNDQLSGNRVTRSGGHGIWLDGARNALVAENALEDNRGDGLSLSGARNNRLRANEIRANRQHGVSTSDSEMNRFEANRVARNQRDGMALTGGSDQALSGNVVEANGAVGVRAEGERGLDLHGNAIRDNNGGGIELRDVTGADLEANAIHDNLHAGLRATDSEASARRNWWGDPLGPAGAFSGRGNAALGLPLDMLVPWLPDRPERLVLDSAHAELIDAVGPDERIEIEAGNRAGLRLELARLGRRPVSLAQVTLARYGEADALGEAIPLPDGALALYSVQVGGLSGGVATVTARYGTLPAGVKPEDLRLWRWDGAAWTALPGGARPAAERVSGELALEQLKPAYLALTPGTGEAAAPAPSQRVPTSTAVEPAKARAPERVAGLDGFSLWGAYLLLGAGRLWRRYRSELLPLPWH